MALNHIQITDAKPREKACKLADPDRLYLVVQANGTMLWRMNCRHLGRHKTLYFRAWPKVGIAAGPAWRLYRCLARARDCRMGSRSDGQDRNEPLELRSSIERADPISVGVSSKSTKGT